MEEIPAGGAVANGSRGEDENQDSRSQVRSEGSMGFVRRRLV